MKNLVSTVASLIFGLGLGALIQSALLFGFENFSATWNGAAILALVHLTLLLPVLLIGAFVVTRLPTDAKIGRLLQMSPLRWSLALALGPALSILLRDAAGLGKGFNPGWLFLVGIAVLAVLLRVLPRSPWRASWLAGIGTVFTLYLAASSFGGLSLGRSSQTSAAAPATPAAGTADIVLISVDTLRADALDAAGMQLPNLQSLAQSGARRSRALAPAPYTLPSHVSMLTGKTPMEHGCYSNFHSVPAEVETMAEILHARGYRTHAVVSNAVLNHETGVAQGFEAYDDSRVAMNAILLRARDSLRTGSWLRWMPQQRTIMGRLIGERIHAGAESTTRLAVKELRALREKEQPFFFFLHYMDPHMPYDPDPSVRGTLSGSPKPPHTFITGRGVHEEMDAIAELLPQRDERALATLAYYHQTYLEELLFLDRQLGSLLEEIRVSGRPTVLLFTADHGEHFGEFDLIAHGNSLHWPVLDVPWILWRSDGLPPGLQVPEVPRLEDAMPLLFEGAGLSPAGASTAARPEHAVAHWQTPPEISIVGERSKLVARYVKRPDGSFDFAEVRFFDLLEDPQELQNLAEARPEEVIVFLKLALRMLEAAPEGEMQEIGEVQRAKLQALGYAEDS